MKSLKPEHLTAIVDTREQLPFSLDPLKVERASLATGDYSVKGLERFIAIERKSLTDYLQCVGRERERFDREMQRLLAYETRAVVIEASWQQLVDGDWRRSKVTPSAALGSALGWIAMGIPIIPAGHKHVADSFCARLLFIAARRRHRELMEFWKATNEAS